MKACSLEKREEYSALNSGNVIYGIHDTKRLFKIMLDMVPVFGIHFIASEGIIQL